MALVQFSGTFGKIFEFDKKRTQQELIANLPMGQKILDHQFYCRNNDHTAANCWLVASTRSFGLFCYFSITSGGKGEEREMGNRLKAIRQCCDLINGAFKFFSVNFFRFFFKTEMSAKGLFSSFFLFLLFGQRLVVALHNESV